MLFGSLTGKQALCRLIDEESAFFLSALGHNLGAVLCFFFFSLKAYCLIALKGDLGCVGEGYEGEMG